jgi:hypothetical protein
MFVHLAFLNGFGSRFSTLGRWLTTMVGRSRMERVFSVAHTGGDLSAPDAAQTAFGAVAFPALRSEADTEADAKS